MIREEEIKLKIIQHHPHASKALFLVIPPPQPSREKRRRRRWDANPGAPESEVFAKLQRRRKALGLDHAAAASLAGATNQGGTRAGREGAGGTGGTGGAEGEREEELLMK